MTLPEHVEACLARLEAGGYPTYAVGGCVRDACLGLQPEDYDLCTAALPEQIRAVFAGERLVLAGVKHGTVGVVTEGGVVEITTFRTEGDYRDHRHPDWVTFVPTVEADLARRDFTINAMAWAPGRGLADPFGGREDLERKVLRAVGDPQRRFQEDALRILRGVRFAARFGLAVEPATEKAMLAQAYQLRNLARERVYGELCNLLTWVSTGDMLRFGPVLAAAIPELEPMLGFDQHSPHHAYDLYTHVAHVVGAVPGDLTLRWAALLHDVGKVPTFTRDQDGRGHFYGHAQVGADMAAEILMGLKAPAEMRQQVAALIAAHMTHLKPDRKLLRRQLSKLGWELMEKEVLLQQADMAGKGTGEHDLAVFDEIWALLGQLREEDACLKVGDLAVNGDDLLALGFRGKAVGDALKALLEQVLEEQVENNKEALLASAQRMQA